MGSADFVDDALITHIATHELAKLRLVYALLPSRRIKRRSSVLDVSLARPSSYVVRCDAMMSRDLINNGVDIHI